MSELKDVADYLKQEGLPGKESMRADIEANDILLHESVVMKKLDEYKVLYNRFKDGDELSDDEIRRMTDLSKELSNHG